MPNQLATPTPSAAARDEMIDACTRCGETRAVAEFYQSQCHDTGHHEVGGYIPGPVIGEHTFAPISRADLARRID